MLLPLFHISYEKQNNKGVLFAFSYFFVLFICFGHSEKIQKHDFSQKKARNAPITEAIRPNNTANKSPLSSSIFVSTNTLPQQTIGIIAPTIPKMKTDTAKKTEKIKWLKLFFPIRSC